MRARRVAAMLATVVVMLVAPEAWAARAPNILKKSFSFRGDAARAFAALLELPRDQKTVLALELSQQAELRAMPEPWEASSDPAGSVSSDLVAMTSNRIHVTVTWDPASVTLLLEGWVSDMSTALPAQGGPAWTFSSPQFTESEIDKLPGYRPLLPKLVALPAKALSGGTVARTLEVPLGGAEHASLALWRIQTWDSKNHPMLRSFILVGFGPTLDARRSWLGSDKDGGSPSRCACRAGRADSGSGGWALGGAAAWIVGRRARRTRALQKRAS